MITVWRIAKAKYVDSAYSGEGARLMAGRWHEAGHRIVYTSASAALAALEVIVHTDTDLLPRTPFVAVPAILPTRLKIQRFSIEELPTNWQESPSPLALRQRGTEWLRQGTTPVLAVPSVIVPFEWNYLLNPAHPDFSKIQVGAAIPYQFDSRLG